jgi:HEAT repeat protein
VSDQEHVAGAAGAPLPKGVDFREPLSPKIFHWLNDVAKTLKGLRVYAENNEMLHKYLSQAHAGLTDLLEQQPELSLAVREDRLLFVKDPVHVTADREEGIPFIFFRNAFRRLTFVKGMSRAELLSLLKAITTDYSTFDYAGEDLVTALWRLSLPHLRYLTIDAISMEAKNAKSVDARREIDRIQGDIEAIVAAIYNTDASAEDIVAGVTITKEDLEALKDIREEAEEDLDALDHATARAIADIQPADLEALKQRLVSEDKDALTQQTVDILVAILFRETSSRESKDTIEVIQQLFDSMVLGQRFNHAAQLVQRLRAVAASGERIQEMHIARHLLKLFSSESRVTPVLNTLSEGYKTATIGEVTDFLRALGADITPHLIRALDSMANPAHRRLICDLVIEFGIPDAGVLLEASKDAKWFVVRDLLTLAQQLPPDAIGPLIAAGIKHAHPKVRAQAVGMLRGYGRGTADRYLAEILERDDDLEVRLSAARVAAARNSAEAKPVLEKLISFEGFSEREPREIRMLTAAYAKIAGTDAVPVLDRVLNPGFFASLKNVEVQIAAAYALGAIGSESAMMILQKGSRSLSGKVREAVKKALTRGEVKTDDLLADTPEDGTKAPPKDGAKIPEAKTEPEAKSTVRKIPEATTEIDAKTVIAVSKNAADVEFSVVRPHDPLERAPDFKPKVAEPAPKKAHDPHKSGPSVTHMARPQVAPERIPDRLFVPPSATTVPDARPPVRPKPASPPAVEEVIPLELPPLETPLRSPPPAFVRQERVPSNLPLPPAPMRNEEVSSAEDFDLSLDDGGEDPGDKPTVKTDDLTLE